MSDDPWITVDDPWITVDNPWIHCGLATLDVG